jgi:hypothetical protein
MTLYVIGSFFHALAARDRVNWWKMITTKSSSDTHLKSVKPVKVLI